MKTLRLIFSLIAFSSSVTYAETATDTQTLTLTVPLVALIDVEDISPTFTFIAPTNAGEGFTGSTTPANNMPLVAISSNNPNAKLNVKVSTNLNDENVVLKLNNISSNLGTCIGNLSVTTSDQKFCDIGMLKTTSGKILINADTGFGSGGGMIPYGEYTTNIIYTLTQN